MRVAICATNNNHSYGGGRYHALIMAYALSAQGYDVTFISNKRPIFTDDLDRIAPGEVSLRLTPDFMSDMPDGSFDYVVLVPTGIFHSNFYEAVLSFAERAGARMALINFESANWFNSLAPVKRDARLWDYWRRSMFDGGLVISSTAESDTFAREFYSSLNAGIHFEVAPPPYNSVAAEMVSNSEVDDALVAFVRTSDPHKGGGDLLSVDESVFKNRILRLISGGDFDPAYLEALQARLSAVKGAKLETYSRLSDIQKFELLARSRTLIFPTRFEGFGYPPVEAAAVGTNTACYDLPVLNETVGDFSEKAPTDDLEALSAAIDRAFEASGNSEKSRAMKAHVSQEYAVEAAGMKLSEALCRGYDAVEPCSQKRFDVHWGPFSAGDAARLKGEEATLFPAQLTGCTGISTGLWIVQAVFHTHVRDAVLEPAIADLEVKFPYAEVMGREGGLHQVAFTFVLAGKGLSDGSTIELLLKSPDGTLLQSAQFRIVRPTRFPPDMSIVYRRLDTDAIVADLTINGRPTDDISAVVAKTMKEGAHWRTAAVTDGQFSLEFGAENPMESGTVIYLVRDRVPVAIIYGYPPGFQSLALLGHTPETEPPRYAIKNLSNEAFFRGVHRRGFGNAAGAIALASSDRHQHVLSVGDTVKLGDGQIRTINDVDIVDGLNIIQFEDPVSPFRAGYPHEVEFVGKGAVNVNLKRRGDGGWRHGVWRTTGDLHGRALLCECLLNDVVFSIGDEVYAEDGDTLLGTVIGVIAHEKECVIWLDRPVPFQFRDRQVLVKAAPRHEDRDSECLYPLDLSPTKGWTRGVSVEKGMRGRKIALKASLGEELVGQYLELPSKRIRQVVGVHQPSDKRCEATLDRAIDDKEEFGPRARVRVLPPSAVDAEALFEYPNALPNERPHWSAVLMNRFTTPADCAPQDGAPSQDTLPAVRPRLMFLSIVSPLPADQGNRVVTLSILRHLVSLGFDVDMVVSNDVPAYRLQAMFGDRVRCFVSPFPNWKRTTLASARSRLLSTVATMEQAGLGEDLIYEIKRSARYYHPYYIVSDEAARLSADLFRNRDYAGIVCNYHHTLRIVEELGQIGELPPVAVFTHDALSRLPIEFNGEPIDTAYRLCAPETERDVLNAVDDALIVAISRTEVDYFKEIGVSNPITLAEYDAFSECYPFRATNASFASRKLVFAGSANPMNVAALSWFYEHCWPAILERVPDAELHVMGRICRVWKVDDPSVHALGELSRMEMLRRVSSAAIAVNPTVLGTGLKIKTIEAASLGTPSVCTPMAVDGLEDRAHRLGRVAETPEAFAEACCEILEDETLWNALNASAIELAREAFSEDGVYAAFDKAMKWSGGTSERLGLRPNSANASRRSGEEVYCQAGGPQTLALLEDIDDAEARAAIIDRRLAGKAHLDQGEKLLAMDVYLDAELYALGMRYALSALASDRGNIAAWKGFARAVYNIHGEHAAKTARSEAALATGLPVASFPVQKKDDESRIEPEPVALDLGTRCLVKSILSPQRLGPGWSEIDRYGAWSVEGYSRLDANIAGRPADRIRQLELDCSANPVGIDEQQSFHLFLNGHYLGEQSVPREEKEPTRLFIELDEDMDIRADAPLVLEFHHVRPSPPRKPDGSVTDYRMLGIRLVALMFK